MNQISTEFNPLSRFGSPAERVARAIAQIKRGGGVIVVDDEDRENEGDIIYPAETITPEQMSLLIRECSGIVCLVLTDARLKALDLPPMVEDNTSKNKTAFTVTIEAKEGVTTGVSAADRVTTIRAAIADDNGPEALARPGHVFPLRAHPGGVLARRGHTEATIELMLLAGRKPAGVLCEVTNPDGTMARVPQLAEVAHRYQMPMVTIEDLVGHKASA
ncbi:MAG TPA: 3,4-dihydroxy-2-butanone-4-phosphate synthase [Telmatospirillum sp.]|nr:3,4-dihydroxy-2-butanone-4-phosphate synthase [Telmatospirillum sp.]